MIKRSAFCVFAIILAVSLLASYSVFNGKKSPKHTNDLSAKTLVLSPQNKTKLVETYQKTSLSFEENLGQTNKEVKYLSRGNGYNLFLTANKATLSLKKSKKSKNPKNPKKLEPNQNPTIVLEMSVLGANANTKLVGEETLAKSSYFIGNDPNKWKSSINNYKKIRCQEIYDGIDLVYYGNQQELEYDFVVKAGANPELIKLGFNGVDTLSLDSKGNLVLKVENEKLVQHKPIIYQIVNGAKEILEGSYQILENNQVAFKLDNYDKSKELVIDPVLAYSTYLGGNGIDFMSDIAVDDNGNVYVVGETQSPNYPVTAGVLDSSLSGSSAAFVTKLDPTGTKLIYSSFIGGGTDNNDAARSIAIDPEGNAYIVGITSSETFPVTSGAIQSTLQGSRDAFIAKLNSTGTTLMYATYLGGTNIDTVNSVTVDSTGNAYMVGSTQSLDFPLTSEVFQPMFKASSQTGYVAKINPTGTTLMYATYLGGSNNENVLDITIDSEGNAYVVGTTSSMDFPVTEGVFQATFAGGIADGFVTKLNPTATALIYSTFLGGTNNETLAGADSINSIAIDTMGNAFLVGDTSSISFPTTEGAFQTTFPGNASGAANSAFATKLNPTGTGLEYSTFLGGDTFDSASNVVVDSMGRIYVFGSTFSGNFPVTQDAIQAKISGDLDVFITQLSATGKELVYSSLLGGTSSDLSIGLALDKEGNVYLAGVTTSNNYPTSTRAFQSKFGNVIDGFVSRMSEKPLPPVGDPMASLSVTNLTFAKQKIGTTSAPMTVMISNKGTASLNISKLMTTGDYAASSTCANAPIDPGKDCAINITFTPTGTKTRTGTLVIMDDAQGSPRTVSLTGKAKK